MVRDIFVFSINLNDQNNLYLTVINNYFEQFENILCNSRRILNTEKRRERYPPDSIGKLLNLVSF